MPPIFHMYNLVKIRLLEKLQATFPLDVVQVFQKDEANATRLNDMQERITYHQSYITGHLEKITMYIAVCKLVKCYMTSPHLL